MLYKLFQRKGRQRPNSFWETNITLMPKPLKDSKNIENYRPLLPVYVHAKTLNTSKLIQHLIKKIIINNWIYFKNARWFNIRKSINIIYHINESLRETNHTIFATDTKKAFDKIENHS